MPNERTERTPMPDLERAKLERRIVRAIQAGRNMTEICRTYAGVNHRMVTKIAIEHGLTIAKGCGRKW